MKTGEFRNVRPPASYIVVLIKIRRFLYQLIISKTKIKIHISRWNRKHNENKSYNENNILAVYTACNLSIVDKV